MDQMGRMGWKYMEFHPDLSRIFGLVQVVMFEKSTILSPQNLQDIACFIPTCFFFFFRGGFLNHERYERNGIWQQPWIHRD